MEFNTLRLFRQLFYDTITKAKDSLFNCAEALLTSLKPARVASLSFRYLLTLSVSGLAFTKPLRMVNLTKQHCVSFLPVLLH